MSVVAPDVAPVGGEDGLTAEQRAAVEDRAGPLLLSAGAGSGKTRVMVERLARAVLEDGVPVDAVLAITFTEKAAAELRERVRARLRDAGDAGRALATEGAWISTIHGFCARLLRRHAVRAGLDPRFTVLAGTDADRLADRALEAALEAVLREADPARERLAAVVRPDVLRDAVREAAATLRARGEERLALPPAPVPDLAGTRAALAAAAEALAPELAAAGEGTTLDRARAALERCGGLLAGEPGAPAAREDLDAAVLRNGAKALGTEACARYRDALAAYTAACTDAEAVPAWALVDDVLQAFDTRYAALKRARGALDFADLELRADALLRDHDDVRAACTARFVHVLVDEFQDTSPLQLRLLERVAAGRLFAVGDELQSIYRFRDADVRLFRRVRAARAAEGRSRSLTVNFRSRPEILAAVNGTFAGAMLEGEQVLALRPGRTAPPAVDAGGPRVELLLTDKAGWDDVPPDPRGTPWRLAEARVLAARLAELRREGVRPGEMVVLVRATAALGVLADALDAAGLPTYVVGGRGYWGHPQVGDLLALLAVVANPLDTPRLLIVLASPAGGLDTDGLIRVSALGGRKADLWPALVRATSGDAPALVPGPAGVAGAERPAGAPPPLPPPAPGDLEVVRRVVALVEGLRALAPRSSLEGLATAAVRRSGLDHAALALPGGPRRLANVRKLLRVAREFEAAEGRDLRAFVDWAGERADDGAEDREGEAPVEGEDLDAVRLMTVHRAKGLEFPVVAVADLGREPPPDRATLRLGDDGRVGFKLPLATGGRAPAFACAELAAAAAAADRAEERRLAYVALTRAGERVLVSGAVDLGAWAGGSARREPVAWLADALVPGLRERAGDAPAVEDVAAEAHGARWRVRVRVTRAEDLPLDGVGPDGTPRGTVQAGALDAAGSPAAAAAAGVAAEPQLALDLEPAGPAAAPADPSPTPPATLSFSSLGQHARCGYRWYLERGLRLPPRREVRPPVADGAAAGPPEPLLDPRVRGSLAHALLETAPLRRPPEPRAEAVVALAAAAGVECPPEAAEEIAALVGRTLRGEIWARLGRARRVRREAPFAFALGDGPLVNGVVDVLADEADGALVVDWKTDRLEGRDPEAVVAGAYRTQRVVYALAALRARAPRVEVAHVLLDAPDAPAVARFAAEDVPALEAELRATAGPLLAGRHEVAARPDRVLCEGCPGRGTLCSWPREATEREPPR